MIWLGLVSLHVTDEARLIEDITDGTEVIASLVAA